MNAGTVVRWYAGTFAKMIFSDNAKMCLLIYYILYIL